jgi:hypothetical protein
MASGKKMIYAGVRGEIVVLTLLFDPCLPSCFSNNLSPNSIDLNRMYANFQFSGVVDMVGQAEYWGVAS